MRRLLVVFCFLTLCSLQVRGAPLGVQKAQQGYFEAAEAAGSFQCLDGSKRIPFSAVNDDNCDCPDGSDEPGTSACATLRDGVVAQLPVGWLFHCTNQGFFEQEFHHSRVNDGICDCCDGSDETASGASCPNRCVEVEKELDRKQKEEQKRMQAALANKAAMQLEATRRKEALAKALPAQQAERDKIAAELPALEERKSEAEKALEGRRQELKTKYDEWEATREEREAVEDGSSCIKWRQTGKCKGDGPREQDYDKDCGERIPSKQSGFCECATDAYEWDADSKDAEHPEDAAQKRDETVTYPFSCGHPELTCTHVCDNNGEAAVGTAYEAPDHPDSYVSPELKAAQEELSTKQARLGELNKLIDKATTELSSTKPSTEALLRTLEGKEFTMDFQEYTYAVTMFKDVNQRNQGHSTGGTLLGKWNSFGENTYAMWAKDAYDLTQMIYDQGMRCWNGVVRRVDMHLVCGPENKLAQVEEPSMCTYRMVFETPAMCDE